MGYLKQESIRVEVYRLRKPLGRPNAETLNSVASEEKTKTSSILKCYFNGSTRAFIALTTIDMSVATRI